MVSVVIKSWCGGGLSLVHSVSKCILLFFAHVTVQSAKGLTDVECNSEGVVINKYTLSQLHGYIAWEQLYQSLWHRKTRVHQIKRLFSNSVLPAINRQELQVVTDLSDVYKGLRAYFVEACR